MLLAQLILAANLIGGSGYNIDSGEHQVVIPDYDPARVTTYGIESGSTSVWELETQTDKETTDEQRHNEEYPRGYRNW